MGEPGSVLVGFIQGYLGALVAMGVSDHFLTTTKATDFWLKWIVRIMLSLTALLFVWAFLAGHSDLVFAWTPFAAITAMLGTEVGRRTYDGF